MTSHPELFVVKGSGADFMEQNKSTVFDWLFIKSERIREKSAVFNERYYSAVKRKQSTDLIQRQQ